MDLDAGGPAIGPQHGVGVQDGDEAVEVAVARGGQEGVDQLALARTVALGLAHRAAYPAPRAGRELAGCGRRAVDDGRDLLERHREHVVEHEGQALGRRQGLQHDQQREAHRVGQQRLVLGVGSVLAVDDRLGHVRAERLLAARAAHPQDIQAYAREHGGQPALEVLTAERRSG